MDALHRTRNAAEAARHAPDAVHPHDAFRPLALPALAAVMQVNAAAAKAARAKLAARRSARIVYEDEPAQ